MRSCCSASSGCADELVVMRRAEPVIVHFKLNFSLPNCLCCCPASLPCLCFCLCSWNQRTLKTQHSKQDLVVIDVLPQMVALSESYFQVYECQQKHTTPPTSAKAAAGAKGGGGGGSKGKAPPKQQQQQKAAGAGKSGS